MTRAPRPTAWALALLAMLATGCATAARPVAAPPRPAAAAPSTAPVTITLLQLNDVYQIGPVEKGTRGGLARVATLKQQITAKSPHTLLLLAGDFLSPSVASRAFKGAQMVAALNAAGLDVATLGNHEFDFGPDVLRERMAESRFTYTVANVTDRRTGKPFGTAVETIVREMGGVRVGIFGLLLTETPTLSNTGADVSFEDAVAAGRRVSRELRARGADVVVALTHLAMPDDKRLAREADIDVILGGHEHELLQSLAGRTPIFKIGSDARNLGRVDLHLVRGASGRFTLQSMDWSEIPVNATVAQDPKVAALVAQYEDELNRSVGEVVGRSSVDLDARAVSVRHHETNIGNFVADVYRESLQADVAIVNGGSLRSDTLLPAGDITKRDVLSILPFENALTKLRVTGAHLRRLLENGVSAADREDGRFPQVSGVAFEYDVTRAPHARVTRVTVGGAPLRDDAAYTVAVSAYLWKGGDDYDLRGAEMLVTPEEGPVEPVVVMEAIRKQGTIAPAVEGRSRIVTPASS